MKLSWSTSLPLWVKQSRPSFSQPLFVWLSVSLELSSVLPCDAAITKLEEITTRDNSWENKVLVFVILCLMIPLTATSGCAHSCICGYTLPQMQVHTPARACMWRVHKCLLQNDKSPHSFNLGKPAYQEKTTHHFPESELILMILRSLEHLKRFKYLEIVPFDMVLKNQLFLFSCRFFPHSRSCVHTPAHADAWISTGDRQKSENLTKTIHDYSTGKSVNLLFWPSCGTVFCMSQVWMFESMSLQCISSLTMIIDTIRLCCGG